MQQYFLNDLVLLFYTDIGPNFDFKQHFKILDQIYI